MPTESGYNSQKMYGTPQYKTVHNVGSDKFATNAITKGLVERTVDPVLVEAVTSGNLGSEVKKQPILIITITGHGAKRAGEVLRVYSGNLENLELDIIQVIDANNFVIYDVMESPLAVGDEVKVTFYRTPQFDIAGNIITNSGPAQYNLDDVPTEVSEDTAFPINNKAFPSAMFIKKEGVAYAVNDSVTPGDVVAVPVKIMSAGGTNINITAGDIDVNLTAMGANFDGVRIGDGSGNYIGVNADTEALVTDAKSLVQLETIATLDFATSEKQEDILTLLAAMAMDTSESAQDLMQMQPDLASLVTIQDDSRTLLGNLALEATQAAQNTLIGAVTEVAPATDTASSGLNGRLQRIAQRISSLISLLPTSLGQKANADSLAVSLSSEQQTILTNIKSDTALLVTSNAARVLNATIGQLATTGTLTPPAGAKGFTIQNSSRANGALRFKATSGASASVGFLLEPGQSTSYQDGANTLSVFDVDAAGIDCSVLWYV